MQDHVLTIGLPPDYDFDFAYQAQAAPFPMSRSSQPELRMGHYSDLKVVGLREVLRRAEESDLVGSHNLFIRGCTEDESVRITLDLEKDSLKNVTVEATIDVDSIIWTTTHPRTKTAVELLVAPTTARKAPIYKNNHAYVNVLLPPTDADRAQHTHPWEEIHLSHSAIPHTRFGKVGPCDILIFFPCMIHRDEHSGFRKTIPPLEVLKVFWDEVVLVALAESTPSFKAAYLDYSTSESIKKLKGKGGGAGSMFAGSTRTVRAAEFEDIVSRMHILMSAAARARGNGGLLDRFGSFFFVFQAKGIKLTTQGPIEASPDLWESLTEEYPQLDWLYMMDRLHGELLVDFAIGYHPVSEDPVVGLWRLEALEASLGAAGFKRGTVHHSAGLARYGAISAEMTVERGRRTHVAYRLTYNLAYETTRPKDNQPTFCEDGDAYELNTAWQDSINSKLETYQSAQDKSYGVRDEYRVGGYAFQTLLHELPQMVCPVSSTLVIHRSVTQAKVRLSISSSPTP